MTDTTTKKKKRIFDSDSDEDENDLTDLKVNIEVPDIFISNISSDNAKSKKPNGPPSKKFKRTCHISYDTDESDDEAEDGREKENEANENSNQNSESSSSASIESSVSVTSIVIDESKEKLEKLKNDCFYCPICLEIFRSPVALPCFHRFCKECIVSSMKSSKKCPNCRHDIPRKFEPKVDFHFESMISTICPPQVMDVEVVQADTNNKSSSSSSSSSRSSTQIPHAAMSSIVTTTGQAGVRGSMHSFYQPISAASSSSSNTTTITTNGNLNTNTSSNTQSRTVSSSTSNASINSNNTKDYLQSLLPKPKQKPTSCTLNKPKPTNSTITNIPAPIVWDLVSPDVETEEEKNSFQLRAPVVISNKGSLNVTGSSDGDVTNGIVDLSSNNSSEVLRSSITNFIGAHTANIDSDNITTPSPVALVNNNDTSSATNNTIQLTDIVNTVNSSSSSLLSSSRCSDIVSINLSTAIPLFSSSTEKRDIIRRSITETCPCLPSTCNCSGWKFIHQIIPYSSKSGEVLGRTAIALSSNNNNNNSYHNMSSGMTNPIMVVNHLNLNGKWMLFPYLTQIDEIWEKVKILMARNFLGTSAKVGLNKNGKTGLICMYTNDCDNLSDVFRVLMSLVDYNPTTITATAATSKAATVSIASAISLSGQNERIEEVSSNTNSTSTIDNDGIHNTKKEKKVSNKPQFLYKRDADTLNGVYVDTLSSGDKKKGKKTSYYMAYPERICEIINNEEICDAATNDVNFAYSNNSGTTKIVQRVLEMVKTTIEEKNEKTGNTKYVCKVVARRTITTTTTTSATNTYPTAVVNKSHENKPSKSTVDIEYFCV